MHTHTHVQTHKHTHTHFHTHTIMYLCLYLKAFSHPSLLSFFFFFLVLVFCRISITLQLTYFLGWNRIWNILCSLCAQVYMETQYPKIWHLSYGQRLCINDRSLASQVTRWLLQQKMCVIYWKDANFFSLKEKSPSMWSDRICQTIEFDPRQNNHTQNVQLTRKCQTVDPGQNSHQVCDVILYDNWPQTQQSPNVWPSGK